MHTRVLPATPRASGPARPLAAAALLALATAVAGCGLFDPATPEPPGGNVGVRLPDLTVDPDSAIYSLVHGLSDEQVDLYNHAFAESTLASDVEFRATFDPQDVAQYQIDTGSLPPSDWSSQAEKTFVVYFLARRPLNYTVRFDPDSSRADQTGSDPTLYYRRYRIFSGTELMAAGVADLTLRRVGVSGEWRLTGWVDRRDTSDTSVRTYGRQRLESLSQ